MDKKALSLSPLEILGESDVVGRGKKMVAIYPKEGSSPKQGILLKIIWLVRDHARGNCVGHELKWQGHTREGARVTVSSPKEGHPLPGTQVEWGQTGSTENSCNFKSRTVPIDSSCVLRIVIHVP